MDLRQEIAQFIDDGMAEAKAKQAAIADEAVEYAIQNGNYHNVTGRLRRSNGSKVDLDGVTIFNTAPYASEVESRGKDVIKGAALYLDKRLKEEFE